MTHKPPSTGWSPYIVVYDPVKAGSIDGTDVTPHDHAVNRAISAVYHPPDESVTTENPEHTLFVGRLDPRTSHKVVEKELSRYGKVRSCKVVRDIVTGASRGYAFVEFDSKDCAQRAWRKAHHTILDGCQIIVEWEFARTMPGWIPRRLGEEILSNHHGSYCTGGGLGGRKESGQLRFGGRDRPFKKPIILKTEDNESTLRDTPDFERPNTSKEDYATNETARCNRENAALFKSAERDRRHLLSDCKERKKPNSYTSGPSYSKEYYEPSSYYKSKKGKVSDGYDDVTCRKDHNQDGVSSGRYKKHHHQDSYDDYRYRRDQYYKGSQDNKFRKQHGNFENADKHQKHDSRWDSLKHSDKKNSMKDFARTERPLSAYSRDYHSKSVDNVDDKHHCKSERHDSPSVLLKSTRSSFFDSSEFETNEYRFHQFDSEVVHKSDGKTNRSLKRKHELSSEVSSDSSSDSDTISSGERKKHKKHKKKKKKKEKKKRKKKKSKDDSMDL